MCFDHQKITHVMLLLRVSKTPIKKTGLALGWQGDPDLASYASQLRRFSGSPLQSPALTQAAETWQGGRCQGQLPEAGRHAPRLRAPQAWVQIQTLPFKGYMILGKSLNHLQSGFPHLYNELVPTS